MSKIKGNLIYQIKNYLINVQGEDSWTEIVESMNEEHKELLSHSIMSPEWYDGMIFENILLGIEKKFGEKEISEMSEYIAEKQLKGFYGILAKFFSLSMLLSKMQIMWSKTWDQGKVELVKKEDDYIKLKTSDFEFSKLHLLHLEHYLVKIFEIATGKQYFVKTKKITKDNYIFEFDIKE